MSCEPLLVKADTGLLSAAIHVAGRVTDPLIGGNLATVADAVGVGMPSLRGAILLLEDFRSIGLGRVDRQLTQLVRSGSLDGLGGVALGLFTGFDGYVDRDWTVLDVMRDQLESLGVPVLGGLKVGHGGVGEDGNYDQVCVGLGSEAVLDTDAGTLTVTPAVREHE